MRFSRFVSKVRTQMEYDPTSFRFDEVILPPNLLDNAKKCKSFQSKMEMYHQELLNHVWAAQEFGIANTSH